MKKYIDTYSGNVMTKKEANRLAVVRIIATVAGFALFTGMLFFLFGGYALFR